MSTWPLPWGINYNWGFVYLFSKSLLNNSCSCMLGWFDSSLWLAHIDLLNRAILKALAQVPCSIFRVHTMKKKKKLQICISKKNKKKKKKQTPALACVIKRRLMNPVLAYFIETHQINEYFMIVYIIWYHAVKLYSNTVLQSVTHRVRLRREMP